MCTPRRSLAMVAALAMAAACADTGTDGRPDDLTAGVTVDSLPRLLTQKPPFHYPPTLYASQIQADVTLRLHVDSTGRVVSESTTVAVASSSAVFDSSAVSGARDLVFRPAMHRGKPMAMSVLFPVKFRVPNAPPLPSDTAGRR